MKCLHFQDNILRKSEVTPLGLSPTSVIRFVMVPLTLFFVFYQAKK